MSGSISRTELRTILWSSWQMEHLDWQDTITWERHHQVLMFCLHSAFWEWLEVQTPIPFSDPPSPRDSSTGYSQGLEYSSQISGFTSCVQHQITLGHLNSKSTEMKSCLSCIPSCPNPPSWRVFIHPACSQKQASGNRHTWSPDVEWLIHTSKWKSQLSPTLSSNCYSLGFPFHEWHSTNSVMRETCSSFLIPSFPHLPRPLPI